jgi:urease accessory protein
MRTQFNCLTRRIGLISGLLALPAATLHAHPLHTSMGGLASGIVHPLFGFDHFLVMLAVGLWAAQLGGRALWLVPGTFLGMVVAGGALGFAGVPVPFAEQGIAASIVVMGLLIVMAARLPIWSGMALVGLFALFHGHAHAVELTAGLSATTYAIGFVLTTALLHLVGIALGVLAQRLQRPILPRLVGVSLLLAGLISLAA